MTARCEKYDLPADSCGHCTGAEARARAEKRSPVIPGSPWFRAAYPGRCSGCGDKTEPGDKIRADGDGGYCCEECGSADALEEMF